MFRTIITSLTATSAALLVGLGIGVAAQPVAPASAGVESTHEVSDWMNTVCSADRPVNCWAEVVGRHHGPAFIREMPGRRHMVCVLFIDHPRHDYCA